MLVASWDGIEPEPDFGVEQTGNVVQYFDSLKIDFGFWPIGLLRRIADAPALTDELDAGYAVLLDKDRLTAGMSPPTYGAYVPARPHEEAFLT